MASIPHTSRTTPLTASEREVIVTFNDAERVWRIFSDLATMRGAVLRLARALGAQVRPVGAHGIDFEVPAEALRLTARRRGGGWGRPFTSRKSAGPASGEGKVAILARS